MYIISLNTYTDILRLYYETVLASQISFRFFLSHVLYPSINACLEKVNWRHPKEHKEELSDFNVTLVDQKATQKLLTKALDSLKAPEGSSWGWCLAAIVVPSEGHLVGIRNNIKNTFPYRISYKRWGYTCQRFSPALGNLGCQGFYQEAPALVQSSDVPEAGWDHRINPPTKMGSPGFPDISQISRRASRTTRRARVAMQWCNCCRKLSWTPRCFSWG